MKGDYGSLTWVNDEDGKEYVCYSDDNKEHKTFEELSENEKKTCQDVSLIVGTERW